MLVKQEPIDVSCSCPVCDGYGMVACPVCQAVVQMLQFQEVEVAEPECSKCRGLGFVTCRNCGGRGHKEP